MGGFLTVTVAESQNITFIHQDNKLKPQEGTHKNNIVLEYWLERHTYPSSKTTLGTHYHRKWARQIGNRRSANLVTVASPLETPFESESYHSILELPFAPVGPGGDALGDEQLVELDPAQLGNVQPLQLLTLLDQ